MFCEGEGHNRKFNLETRLLEFASAVIDLSETPPKTRAGNQVAGQILRSGTSPYPQHGEAEDAESRDDFVHKFLSESEEWIRIFYSSVQTAKRNALAERRQQRA